MKAKLILYGWTLSLLGLIGGLGILEHARERGEGNILLGLGLIGFFALMSCLITHYSEIVDAEYERLGRWCIKTFKTHEIPQWVMWVVVLGSFLLVIFKI
jgi:hypothetical protein